MLSQICPQKHFAFIIMSEPLIYVGLPFVAVEGITLRLFTGQVYDFR